MAPTFTINPAWPHVAGVLSIAIALFIGVFRNIFLDATDPFHCNALLNNGRWLDSNHRNWQPEGCMMHSYGPKEGAACLASRDVVFVGDSVTRKLFFQFANALDPSLPISPDSDDKKHQNHELKSKAGTRVLFFWDPFLNGTYITDALSGTPISTSQHEMEPPALMVLGTGLWYLRYADTSGGIPAWEANIESVFERLSTRTPDRGIADSVVLQPVEELVPSKLSPERAATMHPSSIDAMNSDLFHRVVQHSTQPGGYPIHLPMVFNDMLDPLATEDGIHYADDLVRKQADIVFNLRCNDVLPKHFPFSKTCCNRYPWPNLTHFVLLALVFLSAPWIICAMSGSDLRHKLANSANPAVLSLLIMSSGLTLIYLSDRSWLWLKEHKQFDTLSFSFLCIVALSTGLATLKRADNEMGFLNRDQTDEWKGWMQLAILIYHYFGASKISGIYNPIRVLVASYLFMTGYGHTTFYLRKADFGFKRIAQVLIRLNLLTILLAYVMDTDYISYYFSPLVSMWYLIIYATLAIGSQFNGHTPILLLKILLSATLTTAFMWQPQLLEYLFGFLDRFFGIQWSPQEWTFRVDLDLWIVYVGMLTSIFVIKARENRWNDHRVWPLASKIAIGSAVVVLVWFFAFELCQESKFAYNRWHPYISFLPVLAFAILRNASVILRSTSSIAFAFVGRCSLETFIIQYHFWLAGDTKGVLLVLPGTRWRPVNILLTSIMFLYLSDRMAYATGQITTRICSEGPPPQSVPQPISTERTPSSSSSNRVEDESDQGQELELPLRSKEQDGIVEPDTPIRPRRWIDRLVDHPPPSTKKSSWWSPFDTLKGRVLASFAVLWALNILWLHT